MVMQEQIESWKQEFGKVFRIRPLPNIEIIYRLVSRNDYMDILSSQMAGDISDPELETVRRCVLNEVEENLFEDRGGLVTVVYEEIMKNSGFTIVESEEL